MTARPLETPRRRNLSNAGTTVTVSSIANRMLFEHLGGFPYAGGDDDESGSRDEEAVALVGPILDHRASEW